MAGLKLGSVPYLNAEPLIWPLETGAIECAHSIIRTLPRDLVEKLANNEVDCAVAPIAAMLDYPNLVPIPEIAIGSRGAVASVLLFHDDPLEELEKIWLDSASRTSNLLIQILRNRASDKPCEYIMPVNDDVPPVVNLPSGHGRLVIGDPALSYASEASAHVGISDLGTLWKEATNHPFVFARWIARNGDIAAELTPLMQKARDWSVLNLHELVDPLAARYDFRTELVDRYLRVNITYMFGPREEAGEKEFFRLARELPK